MQPFWRLAIVVGVFALLAISVTLIALVAQDGRWFAEAAEPPAAEIEAQPDGATTAPPADVPTDALARTEVSVVEQRSFYHGEDLRRFRQFNRQITLDPAGVCGALEAFGFEMSAWEASPLENGGWTCVSDIREETIAQGSPAPSSIFIMLGGAVADQASTLRIKVNLTDPDTSAAGRVSVSNLVRELHDILGWPTPPALIQALDWDEEARFTVSGVSYTVSKEISDPRRFNIIMETNVLDRGRPNRFVVPEEDPWLTLGAGEASEE